MKLIQRWKRVEVLCIEYDILIQKFPRKYLHIYFFVKENFGSTVAINVKKLL
jgi:hypothetical protein